MPKYRAGLHKQISSIFKGVPIQRGDGTDRSGVVPTPGSPIHKERARQVPGQQERVVKPDAPVVTPAAPSHMSPVSPQPVAPPETTMPLGPATQPKPVAAPPKPKQPERISTRPTPPRQPKVSVPAETTQTARWQQAWEQVKGKLFVPKPGVSAARQKAMMILIPILFIVFVFVLTRVFSTPSKSRRAQSPGIGPAKAVAGFQEDTGWQIPPPYPTTLRDPMQFGSATGGYGQAGELTIKGIVYSKDDPSAIIGTQIVHQGDKVGGATVIKITKDSVEFEMDGKKWTQKVEY